MGYDCNNYDNNDVAFNRFVNLDNIEWHMIMDLVNSESKYARNIWKILKYDTADCLLQDDVSREDRLDLIYTGNGDASVKRVFMTPYVDDGWTVFLHEFDEVGQRRLLFILSEQGRFGRGGRKGRRGERGAQGRGKGRGFQSKRHIASFSQWKDGWRRGCWS